MTTFTMLYSQRRATYFSQGGDSGGSVYGNKCAWMALGVTSGGTSTGRSRRTVTSPRSRGIGVHIGVDPRLAAEEKDGTVVACSRVGMLRTVKVELAAELGGRAVTDLAGQGAHRPIIER